MITPDLCFIDEQRAMIRGKYAPRASEAEFQVLLEIARVRKLNPITSQIYFIERGGKWSVQVGIDGLRALAQRSGLYAGQDEPEFVEVEGKLVLCKVRVYRKDWGDRACVGVAYWDEYGARASNPLWKTLPHGMLAKVAEALALRKAFPEDTSGLYTHDEMDRNVGHVPAPSEPKPLSVAALDALDFIENTDAADIAENFKQLHGRFVTDSQELEMLRAAYLRKVGQ